MFLCVIGCICLCICVCVLCICFRASWSLCREDAAAVLGAKEEWGQRPATPTSRRTISWNQKKKTFVFIILVFFIGLKSNPCLAGPVSQSVSQWPCWDLTHVPLACEDSPKLSLHVELNILICQSCYFQNKNVQYSAVGHNVLTALSLSSTFFPKFLDKSKLKQVPISAVKQEPFLLLIFSLPFFTEP